jgi:hypothetical protein
MRRSKKMNDLDKSSNYVLIRITTRDGDNLLEREESKKLVNDLRSYIIGHGGEFYTAESIVLLEDRKPLRYDGIIGRYRVFNIPLKLIKSRKIDPALKYDIVIFNGRDR